MKDVFKIFTVSKEIYDDLKAHPQEWITFLGKCRIRVKEIWKDVKDYEGRYQVSNFGRINSLPKKIRRNDLSKEKILKPSLRVGYNSIRLYKNDDSKLFNIHRLVAIAFIQNPHNKPWINHKNITRTDNYVWNIEWCTPQENNIHALKAGLIKCGQNRIDAKLTNKQAKSIREALKNGKEQRELAEKFNISQYTINQIEKNRSYRDDTLPTKLHTSNKLSQKDVNKIKNSTDKLNILSALFGVSNSTIIRIRKKY